MNIQTPVFENKIIDEKLSKPVYLSGLNGIRAIAALGVVISHITLGLGMFGLDSTIFGKDSGGHATGLNLAGYGVTIFFTLSGFLITFLLLKEKEKANINIPKFYVRRILRIWPLYYLYFFISMATMLIFGLTYIQSSIPFYLFLAANIPFILGTTLPLVGHYWSLGVEEQFYLFFPQLAKYPNRKLLRVCILLIISTILLKFIAWAIQEYYGLELPYSIISVSRFHTMLLGVVGAILYYFRNPIFLSLSTYKVTQITSWTVILLIALNKFHIFSLIDGELVSVITVFLIMGQITKRNNIINLENKVCDFIGKISYGIYVIHPIIIFYFSKIIGNFSSHSVYNYLLVYVVVITITIVLSYISYEFYEKRFLKIKEKYTTVKSSNVSVAFPKQPNPVGQ